MNQKEIEEYLKNNLKVTGYSPYRTAFVIQLQLNNKIISETMFDLND